MTHYVENVGTEDVVFVEVLQADHFSGNPDLIYLN
jgi:oxalate decarboxylase/phosphoglucose isomerase-like protein (cupin superfamily)